MITVNIKCANGCDTILGSVELDDISNFKGHAGYSMYCGNCNRTQKKESELEKLKKEIEELKALINNK